MATMAGQYNRGNGNSGNNRNYSGQNQHYNNGQGGQRNYSDQNRQGVGGYQSRTMEAVILMAVAIRKK